MGTESAASLKLTCACGKRVAVPRTWAGKRVRCPKCQSPILVPAEGTEPARTAAPKPSRPAAPAAAVAPASAAASDDDLILKLAEGDELERPRETAVQAEAAAIAAASGPRRTCPACRQTLPASAKICVGCGIDLKTGRAIAMRDDSHLDQAYIYAENIVRVVSWLFFFGIYPVASEAFGTRKPWVIRGVAALTVVVSVWYMAMFIYASEPDPALARWMHWAGDQPPDPELQEVFGEYTQTRWYQPITSAFLHGGPLHLLGNLLFLFVLGSRVNMLVGNLLTLVLYPLLAVGAGIIDAAANQEAARFPTLGASGAIMGLAGMYLVLFPATHVHMVAWWRWGLIGGFRLAMNIFPVRGFWVVLFYIAFDVVATILGSSDGVAHWAHLGGFIVGAAIALVLVVGRLVNARGGDLISVALGSRAWAIIGKPGAPRLSLP